LYGLVVNSRFSKAVITLPNMMNWNWEGLCYVIDQCFGFSVGTIISNINGEMMVSLLSITI